MMKWHSLATIVALASICTSLEAGIFDRLVQDTSVEPIPLTSEVGGADDSAAETHLPPPTVELENVDQESATSGFGYPLKTDCCETHNACIKNLWQGYCGRGHGACERLMSNFTEHLRGDGCKGDCGQGHCGHRAWGGKGCSTGKCGHTAIAYGKVVDNVQHSYAKFPQVQRSHVQRKGHVVERSHVQRKTQVQRTHVQRTHVQRSHVQWGHVQHGKGLSDCHTCGKTPCDCLTKGHHQKNFRIGCHGKSCGKQGCAKGECGKATARHGKNTKNNFLAGLFSRWHHCNTCGKSTIVGFGKGGCDCGAIGTVKGWSPKGTVIWGKSDSFDVPYGQPTPAFDPPVELQIPIPADTLPAPPLPTGYSAFIRSLPRVGGSRY